MAESLKQAELAEKLRQDTELAIAASLAEEKSQVEKRELRDAVEAQNLQKAVKESLSQEEVPEELNKDIELAIAASVNEEEENPLVKNLRESREKNLTGSNLDPESIKKQDKIREQISLLIAKQRSENETNQD